MKIRIVSKGYYEKMKEYADFKFIDVGKTDLRKWAKIGRIFLLFKRGKMTRGEKYGKRMSNVRE